MSLPLSKSIPRPNSVNFPGIRGQDNLTFKSGFGTPIDIEVGLLPQGQYVGKKNRCRRFLVPSQLPEHILYFPFSAFHHSYESFCHNSYCTTSTGCSPRPSDASLCRIRCRQCQAPLCHPCSLCRRGSLWYLLLSSPSSSASMAIIVVFLPPLECDTSHPFPVRPVVQVKVTQHELVTASVASLPTITTLRLVLY